jgi:hypothetical protein
MVRTGLLLNIFAIAVLLFFTWLQAGLII